MFMTHSSHDGDIEPSAAASSPAPRLMRHRHDDARRADVERFIRAVFARRYGADVRHFAPTLISLQDRGEIVAAAGYRSAAEAPLFLERYLPSPVEALIAPHAGSPPRRHSIVEVGHLAASRAGEGRRLIALMGSHLAAQDFVWVVGTITSDLRRLFKRFGVTPLALGAADPAALGPEVANWGSYYEHQPMVLAGQLDEALRRLAWPAPRTT